MLCKSGIEPQNHKGLRFVANSESYIQPRMVSHELGFISLWSGHITGDSSEAGPRMRELETPTDTSGFQL